MSNSIPLEIPVVHHQPPLYFKQFLARDGATQFADISQAVNEIDRSSIAIEDEFEAFWIPDKCDNDLYEFYRQDLHEYEQGNAYLLKAAYEQYVVPGFFFLFKFDVKSGYHHIDIAYSHQQFTSIRVVICAFPLYKVFSTTSVLDIGGLRVLISF